MLLKTRYLYAVKSVKEGSFYRAESTRIPEGQGLTDWLEDAEHDCIFFTRSECLKTESAWNKAFEENKQKEIENFLSTFEEPERGQILQETLSRGFYHKPIVEVNGTTMVIKDEEHNTSAVLYKGGHWTVYSKETGAKILCGSDVDFATAWDKIRAGCSYDYKERKFKG